ncbi:MAG: glycosyltransferase family 9 protein [Kiritimatiellales bacterium]
MRILIVKTGLPGDLLDALPAVHLLKTGLNTEIDWAVNDGCAALVACFDDVTDVIPLPPQSLFPNIGQFFSKVRKNRYDLVVDLDGGLRSALIARFARSHKRIGPSFHRDFSYLFYDHIAAERNHNRPAVDQNLDVLRFLELPTEPVEFPVTLPSTDISDAAVSAAREILEQKK